MIHADATTSVEAEERTNGATTAAEVEVEVEVEGEGNGERKASVAASSVSPGPLAVSKVCLPAQSAHTSAPIRTGDRVAARYQAAKYGVALTKWYPGVALCVHSDGSCDVRFDDGDSEDHVPPQFVRAARPADGVVDVDVGVVTKPSKPGSGAHCDGGEGDGPDGVGVGHGGDGGLSAEHGETDEMEA